MPMPPGPPGTGIVIPPEMMAELQKKIHEKFPDAKIPFVTENFMNKMPLTIPVSNMRFKPPMHLVPNSSGYYGDSNKKNKKKEETKKQPEENKTKEAPEILFDNSNLDEKVISRQEIEHYKELEKYGNKEYLDMKIKEKAKVIMEKMKKRASDASPENIKEIYKEIFTNMKETVKKLKQTMMENIQKRIEENIAAIRAEIHNTQRICEDFEYVFCKGEDLSKIEPSKRREKIDIPKEFKIDKLIELQEKEKIQKHIEELPPNERIETQRNITICHTYFTDLIASIRHKFGDISKFEELDYLSKKDIDEVVEKVMADFVPINLFSETRDTLKKGTNPALYSFEWNSNLVNIYQIKERKSECRVVKFPNGFPIFSRLAITYEGRVFLTGGFFKELEQSLRTVYEYIEKENKMKRRANMIYRRSDHSLIYNKGYIYAVGAFVEGKISNSVERYDVKNNVWEERDFMNVPRAGVGLCVFNSNYLFAFGGRNEYNTHLNVIESYDIAKDIWREIDYAKTELWEEGAYLSQAHQISKDKIIIFGKSGGHSEGEVKS